MENSPNNTDNQAEPRLPMRRQPNRFFNGMRLRGFLKHLRLSSLLGALIPPRPSERLLDALSIEVLRGLSAPKKTAEFQALLPYQDPRVMALVWELKYHRSARAAALAAAHLEEPLASLAEEELGTPLLIPMPMHPARRKERGFNQTEMLCEAAFKLRSPSIYLYAPHVLLRVRHTAPQQGLPRAKRLTNVRNSMEVKNPADVFGRACVVVDDVATTGATFSEARRALMQAGARAVHCIALAA